MHLVGSNTQAHNRFLEIIVYRDDGIRRLQHCLNPASPTRLAGHNQNVRATNDHTGRSPNQATDPDRCFTIRMRPVADDQLRAMRPDQRPDRPRNRRPVERAVPVSKIFGG